MDNIGIKLLIDIVKNINWKKIVSFEYIKYIKYIPLEKAVEKFHEETKKLALKNFINKSIVTVSELNSIAANSLRDKIDIYAVDLSVNKFCKIDNQNIKQYKLHQLADGSFNLYAHTEPENFHKKNMMYKKIFISNKDCNKVIKKYKQDFKISN